jgi:hypothetical protein
MDDKSDGESDPLTALLKSIQGTASSIRVVERDPEQEEDLNASGFPMSADDAEDCG